MIITRTPFRISFFGGGTDYPTWANAHGGEVLSTTDYASGGNAECRDDQGMRFDLFRPRPGY